MFANFHSLSTPVNSLATGSKTSWLLNNCLSWISASFIQYNTSETLFVQLLGDKLLLQSN